MLSLSRCTHPPSGFLVHNLVLAHARGLDITNILLKNKKKVYSAFSNASPSRDWWENQQLSLARALGRQSHQYFDFFHHLMCCLLSSLERRWNARTSFKSPRQCEVWHFITGARETVTVTLLIHSYYSSCHVKVRQCTRYKTPQKMVKAAQP